MPTVFGPNCAAPSGWLPRPAEPGGESSERCGPVDAIELGEIGNGPAGSAVHGRGALASGGGGLGVEPAGAAQRFEAVAFCLGQGDWVSLDLAQRRLEVVQARIGCCLDGQPAFALAAARGGEVRAGLAARSGGPLRLV